MPKKTNKKVKVVKAWAVFTKEDEIKSALAFEDCSSCGQIADVHGLFLTKDDAESMRSLYLKEEVKRVEVTITYNI